MTCLQEKLDLTDKLKSQADALVKAESEIARLKKEHADELDRLKKTSSMQSSDIVKDFEARITKLQKRGRRASRPA